MEKIDLQYPVADGEKTISEIHLRRAKVRDIEIVQKAIEAGGEMAGSIASVACLSGLGEDVIREIDAADFVKIAGVMGDFLPLGPNGATGER